MNEAEYAAALKACGDSFIAAQGAGRGNIVKLVVAATLAGDMGWAEYRESPPHLPDDDAGLFKLLKSKVEADQPVREDMLKWANDNLDIQSRNAKTLESLLVAWRAIKAEPADPENDSADDSSYLADHAWDAFKADLYKAPENRSRVYDWARAVVCKTNPTPAWVLGGGRMLEPTTPSVGTRASRAWKDDGEDGLS